MPFEPPRDAPLTFVFTDVEGSTAAWERHGAAFQLALARHDALVREALLRHHGYEVKAAGDGFLLAFEADDEALAFCLDVQARIAAAPWAPVEPLRVRMGVHRGRAHAEAHPVSGRWDFFGPVVNKAARIEASAHGGQIVASDEVRRGPELAWVDLGAHMLRGLEGRHALWQLGPEAFPPLRTAGPASNLPARADRFVGRAAELEALAGHVRRGDRVLTLLGPGGTGKTRLALRFAAEAQRLGYVGAWFIDLAEATDLADVLQATAKALEVPIGGDDLAPLGHALAGRGRAAFLFDNVEQVAQDSATALGRWVEMAPEALFLLTSRVPTWLRGEVVYTVDPLPEADAVDLFRERAPGVAASQAELSALVRALDGLPLAVELAAARTRVLSVSGMLERLHDRFRLLVSRGGDRPERHATLAACLDVSWELLPAEVRRSLGGTAVFEGGFDLAAAEAVLGPVALDHLQVLVEQALVRVDAARERYHVLPTIAGYAAGRIEADERAAFEAAHARHYGALGGAPPGDAEGAASPERRALLARELDNLRLAVRRSAQRGAWVEAGGAALAVWEVLSLRGPFEAGRALFSEVLAGTPPAPLRARLLVRRADALRFLGRAPEALGDIAAAEALGGDDALRAELEATRGSVLRDLGRLDEAESAYARALAGYRELASLRGEGIALGHLALLAHDRGRSPDTRRLLGDALERHRAVGNRRWEGITRAHLGILAREEGALGVGRAHFEAALAALREVGDRRFEAVTMGNLAGLLRQAGELAEALDHGEAALALHRELGNRRGEALALGNLGLALRDLGQLEAARERMEQSLTVQWSLGNRRGTAWARRLLGTVLLVQGDRASARVELDGALVAAEGVERALPLVSLAWWHVRAGEAEAALGRLGEVPPSWPPEAHERALADAIAAWAEGDLPRLAEVRARVRGTWISPWSELGDVLGHAPGEDPEARASTSAARGVPADAAR